MFAEEHPSDGNYLALSAGGVFGIPLTDPLEENPQYTINASNIGDLIDGHTKPGRHTSRAPPGRVTTPSTVTTGMTICRSSTSPTCAIAPPTVPRTYRRSTRCRAISRALRPLPTSSGSAQRLQRHGGMRDPSGRHVPQTGARRDPQFTRVAHAAVAGDHHLRRGRLRPRAPAQRIPTLILGSAGVRDGYVSHVRYTHYSLLRTIEAALGLGTLTANDRYAQPLNDVFARGSRAAAVPRLPSPGRAPRSTDRCFLQRRPRRHPPRRPHSSPTQPRQVSPRFHS